MTDAISLQAPEMNTAPRSKVRVWDPQVRVFHWGLVAAYSTAWLTADELQPVHEFAGYTVAVLVAFAALHVGGVVLASFRHHENLARAMVTGDKRGPTPGDIA